jgi:hypothetical protein
MAPIPHVQKKKPQARPASVSTDNVYDNLGKSMSQLLRSQSYNNNTQRGDITVARQYARKNDSNSSSSIILRDVFPGMKYKIHLNNASWVSEERHLQVGYNTNREFHILEDHTEPPAENLIELELPSDVDPIDYMEIRIPSGQNLEAYLEDATETGSIWEKIADLITDIIGLSDENKELKERIEELERIAQDHEERISALEDK